MEGEGWEEDGRVEGGREKREGEKPGREEEKGRALFQRSPSPGAQRGLASSALCIRRLSEAGWSSAE